MKSNFLSTFNDNFFIKFSEDCTNAWGESQPTLPYGAVKGAETGVMFNVFGIERQNDFVLVVLL